MAPAAPAAAGKRCPISGKVGLCPMMAKAAAAKTIDHAPPPLQEQETQANDQHETELQALLQSGSEHLDERAHVKALKAFTRAVDLSPANEEACFGKVTALRRLGRPRGALKACALAIQRLSPEASSERLVEAREQLTEELGDDAAEVLADDAEAVAATLSDGDSQASAADSGASTGEDSPAAACPASKSLAAAKRELAAMQAKPRRSTALEAELSRMDTEESLPYRQALKEELIGCYRELYQRVSTKNVDTSQYTKTEKKGLVIKGGHQHMPRPDQVEVPEDWKQPVGTMTPSELAKFGASSKRLLLSLHGDIFDVSDRPDKYGAEGPYNSMAGHDITWALWSGLDDEDEWDKYFDLLRAEPRDQRDRRFQGLMSWWAFFEQEYGNPVGRLSVYEREWELESPPAVRELCTVM